MKKTSLLHVIILLFIKEVFLIPFNAKEDTQLGETQVLRCFPVSLADLLFLNNLKSNLAYDFWLAPRQVGMPVDIMAGGQDLEELKAILESKGINFNIFIADVASANEMIIKDNNEAKMRYQSGSGGFFEAYHTYEEIVEWMKGLSSAHRGKVNLIKMGRSFELREMYAIKLSKSISLNRPAIWIEGGAHAREWISTAVVTYMLNELLTNSSYDSVLDNMDFYFLPVLNPDGYDFTFTEEGRLWRKTRSKTNSAIGCLGVDINRNWRFHWNNSAPEKDRNPCSDNFAGEEPFSEKEARNAKEKMIASIWNLKGYLSYHSYAQLFLFPWGYTTDFVNDFADMETVSGAAVDAIYTYSGTRYKQQPYCVESDLCVYGNSIDYFKGLTTIKYCFLVQLPDLGNYGYLLPPTEIIPVGEESLRGLLAVVDAIIRE